MDSGRRSSSTQGIQQAGAGVLTSGWDAASRRPGDGHHDAGRSRRRVALFGIVIIAALYGLLLVSLLPVGIDNLRIAAVFSTDEALSGSIVRSMIVHHTIDPNHFFAYGAVYHEAAALPLMPFSWLGLGDRAALLSLRSVSLAGGTATLLLTGLLGGRLYGWWAGVLASVLLATSAELARWSITAHPDTLQLALITGGLVAVAAVRDRPSTARIGVAALLAGLAFGTKYAGLMLLPLIALALLCALVEAARTGTSLLRSFVMWTAFACAVFAASFVASNPFALVEWRRFLTQFEAEIQHARAGHVFAGASGWWRWIEIVASPKGVGALTVAVAVVGGAVLLIGRVQAWREARTTRWWRLAVALDAPMLIALWTAGYIVYLIGFVGLYEPRYALPALPGIAVLAAGFATSALRRVGPGVAVAGSTLLVVLAFATAISPLRDMYTARIEQRADGDNPRIAAGMWLATHVDASASILADAYVYVPPSFADVTETFGLTAEQIGTSRPVVIITNEDIRGRFRDPTRAGQYLDGADAFRRRATAYERIEGDGLGCYRLMQDFGSVRIYGDEDALRRGTQHGCGGA